MSEYTTQQYWEDYYNSKDKPNKDQIIYVCSEYDKFWDLLVTNNSENPPKTIMEIGGYPGRYIAYLADKYNLIPTSIDYNSDREKIEETFKAFDIKEYEIIQADIFNHKVDLQYDIVISNGFIEHFENYNEVLDKHCNYLKEGGTLFVLVPNMRNYIHFYKYLVDYKNLLIHNLKCMKISVFNKFAQRNNLKIILIDYYGGFPFNVHQKLSFFQKIIFKPHRILFKFYVNKLLKKYPNKYFSSTIVGVYKK